MAATQYSDYYYNNSSYYQQHYAQQQQQNAVYGQYYDGKTDALNYNYPPNNYNDQWSSYYQQQPQYHHQQQQLSTLNNQINENYAHYSSSKSAMVNENQPNLNGNQYVKNDDLFYGQQQQNFMQYATTTTSAASQQLGESRKRKIDNAADDDSPALRALLTKPSKRAKYVKSPYFYQRGNVSPASSSTSEHYQMPSITSVESSINLSLNYGKSPLKDGYESSINAASTDEKFSAAVSPISSNYVTPPSSPRDSSKHDDSAQSGAAIWNEQNEGEFKNDENFEDGKNKMIRGGCGSEILIKKIN